MSAFFNLKFFFLFYNLRLPTLGQTLGDGEGQGSLVCCGS